MNKPKFGLVLAGGGAKGAYQVGALKYLSEVGFEPTVIAGTSIGTLNGGLIASSISFNDGVKKLEDIWKALAKKKLIKINNSVIRDSIAKKTISKIFDPIQSILIKNGIFKNSDYLFDPTPLELIIKENISLDKIKEGIEFWATIFPIEEVPNFNFRSIRKLIHSIVTKDAQYVKLADLQNEEDLQNVLLASAAIPFLFPSRKFNKRIYIDGGVADNTPLKVLQNVGCTHAIVIHLEHGTTWDRHKFEDITIIEVRPDNPINKINIPVLGSIDSLLDFSEQKIELLINEGYKDSKKAISSILNTLSTVNNQRSNLNKLIQNTKDLLNDKSKLFKNDTQ